MKKVVIASACRTDIGKFGGGLSTVPARTLGATVIKEAVNRAGIKPTDVDQVYMGCVLQLASARTSPASAPWTRVFPSSAPQSPSTWSAAPASTRSTRPSR